MVPSSDVTFDARLWSLCREKKGRARWCCVAVRVMELVELMEKVQVVYQSLYHIILHYSKLEEFSVLYIIVYNIIIIRSVLTYMMHLSI